MLYPLTFKPILKPKVWGGRRLASIGKILPPRVNIGESWEVADLPPEVADGRSIVANGRHAGRSLHSVVKEDVHAWLGRVGAAGWERFGGFPLLIKYLDAREHLSVQVHPSEAYAAAHPDAHLKSEAWVIVDAEPDAVIFKGIKAGVTREAFARHIRSGQVVDDLIAIPVKPGDCHYLPSGTCHALGAGVLVAEVQIPSDTTFRVFDWGRTDRALHVDQALQCIDFESPPESERIPPIIETGDFTTADLCATPYFEIQHLKARAGSDLEIVTDGSPVIWMFMKGRGSICADGADCVACDAGSTVLVGADMKAASIAFDTDCTVLRVTLPRGTRGLLA